MLALRFGVVTIQLKLPCSMGMVAMRVRLRFERVYGTLSQYGENPRESPAGSPIVLDDYPLPGERVAIYLGGPVEELYRSYEIARKGGWMLVRRNVIHEQITDAEQGLRTTDRLHYSRRLDSVKGRVYDSRG